MAYVVKADGRELQAEEALTFLQSEGIPYERWDLDGFSGRLVADYDLTDDEKEAILSHFVDPIEILKEKNHYQTADIVVLSAATPNLDGLLQMFQRKHHHSEDEVRFVVDGHGVFTILGADDQYFNVHVGPGDLLVVPNGRSHAFWLAEDRKIKCVRLFQSKDGWQALFEDQSTTTA